jgi:hypothetical protein
MKTKLVYLLLCIHIRSIETCKHHKWGQNYEQFRASDSVYTKEWKNVLVIIKKQPSMWYIEWVLGRSGGGGGLAGSLCVQYVYCKVCTLCTLLQEWTQGGCRPSSLFAILNINSNITDFAIEYHTAQFAMVCPFFGHTTQQCGHSTNTLPYSSVTPCILIALLLAHSWPK